MLLVLGDVLANGNADYVPCNWDRDDGGSDESPQSLAWLDWTPANARSRGARAHWFCQVGHPVGQKVSRIPEQPTSCPSGRKGIVRISYIILRIRPLLEQRSTVRRNDGVPMTFAEKLRKFRDTAGLTQEQMAVRRLDLFIAKSYHLLVVETNSLFLMVRPMQAP